MKNLLIDTNIVIDLLAKRDSKIPAMAAEQFLKSYNI